LTATVTTSAKKTTMFPFPLNLSKFTAIWSKGMLNLYITSANSSGERTSTKNAPSLLMLLTSRYYFAKYSIENSHILFFYDY
jgi:hypothetical protein